MVYRYDADYNGEVVAEAKLRRAQLLPRSALPGLRHPRAGPGAVREELDPADLRRRLRAGPAPAHAAPGQRPAAGPHLLDAAQRLADPHRVPEEHGRPGVDVDLARYATTGSGVSSPATTTAVRTPRRTPPARRRNSSARRCRCAWSTGPRRTRSSGPCRSGRTLAWLTGRHARRGPAARRDAAGRPQPARPGAGRRRRRETAGHRGRRGDAVPTPVADAIAAWAAAPGRRRRRDRLPVARPRRISACRSTLACGVLVLPLPDGPVRALVRAARRCSTSTGAATRTTRRSPNARATSPAESAQVLRPVAGDRPGPVRAVDRRSSCRRRPSCAPTCSRPSTPGRAASCGPPRRCSAACSPTRPSPSHARGGGALRARRTRGPGRRRLVRRVRSAGRLDDARHRRRRRATTPRPPPTWAQLRGLLRGIAFDSDDGPSGVLGRLDAAIEGLAARRDGHRAGRPAGTGRRTITAGSRLRWASAGHLPPLVVDPDGRRRAAAHGAARSAAGRRRERDPDRARRSRSRRDRRCCSTPTASSSAGTRSSTTASRCSARRWPTCASCPSGRVCDALLARLLPERSMDDVALVAVRLRAPQKE